MEITNIAFGVLNNVRNSAQARLKIEDISEAPDRLEKALAGVTADRRGDGRQRKRLQREDFKRGQILVGQGIERCFVPAIPASASTLVVSLLAADEVPDELRNDLQRVLPELREREAASGKAKELAKPGGRYPLQGGALPIGNLGRISSEVASYLVAPRASPGAEPAWDLQKEPEQVRSVQQKGYFKIDLPFDLAVRFLEVRQVLIRVQHVAHCMLHCEHLALVDGTEQPVDEFNILVRAERDGAQREVHRAAVR